MQRNGLIFGAVCGGLHCIQKVVGASKFLAASAKCLRTDGSATHHALVNNANFSPTVLLSYIKGEYNSDRNRIFRTGLVIRVATVQLMIKSLKRKKRRGLQLSRYLFEKEIGHSILWARWMISFE